MFRKKYQIAWTFHRNTCRWPYNLIEPKQEQGTEPAYKEYIGVQSIPLPDVTAPETSLKEAIAARFSCRRFSGAPLTLLQLATILKISYGIQNKTALGDLEFLERPVPSGGGLYPLELYVLVQNINSIQPGIYHYSVLHHVLEQIQSVTLPKSLVSRLFMGQPYITNASAIIVLTGVVERSFWRYGDRGYRYILYEAGHVAQNLNLTSGAMGCASLNLGGFFDDDLAAILLLDIEAEIPLYAVAVGIPSGEDRIQLRQPENQGYY